MVVQVHSLTPRLPPLSFRFVLAAYALAFMVILPLVVGMWWYKSIRYTGEKILLDTTQLYFYFFHKTPNMVMRRVIMILGASLEFSKMHNPEIEVRPSDNYEVTQLMKELSNLGKGGRRRRRSRRRKKKRLLVWGDVLLTLSARWF